MGKIYACLIGEWVCLNDDENCIWELIIGRLRFGSTEIILDLKKWEIIDDTLVG